MLAFVTGATSNYTAEPLLGGIDGTEQTIWKIRELVDEAWKTFDVRALAVQILREAGAPQYDDWSKISAIYNWVRNHFYFINDPPGKEVLMPFVDLLNLGAGDCDEINAIAMAVLLGAVGFDVRLVTVAANSDDPSQFSHIYTEVLVNGNWVPMDAARPGAQMATAPLSFYQREWWSLVDDAHGPYPGSGQLGRARRLGLGQYSRFDTMTLGQDGDGNLPLPDPSSIGPSLDPLNPGIVPYYGPGLDPLTGEIAAPGTFGNPFSGSASQPSGTGIFSSIAQAFSSIATPVVSVVKNLVGPGGTTVLAPTHGTAVASSGTVGGIGMNTLLLGGVAVIGGLLLFGAMRKK